MSLRIGITCYPTFGGSGIVATEIGLGMARRGHRVHFICSEIPVRLDWHENVFFHGVDGATYPLMRHSAYALALTSKMVDVCAHEGLDVLHVHYAVPHATSAFLARQVLGDAAPPVITTLHGTDITLVGADPSYLPITRHSIQHSQAVTTPSKFLREATYEQLGLSREVDIDVIPNFVDTDHYAPPETRDRRRFDTLCHRGAEHLHNTPVLFHVSNFRPVKRVMDVLRVFEKVNAERPCRLILVGDGPDRPIAEQWVRERNLTCRVCFLGRQEHFIGLLQHADVFLMPSESESFGLAALEAMSCGVPVVASNIGGLPEVVCPNAGRLHPVGDIDAMAHSVLAWFSDASAHDAARVAARQNALTYWKQEPMLDRYEACYRRVIGRS